MTTATDRRPIIEDDGEHGDDRREIEQLVPPAEGDVAGADYAWHGMRAGARTASVIGATTPTRRDVP